MFDVNGLLSGFLGAFVTAILGYFGLIRKAKADETSIALSAWKELLAPLQEELRAAKEEIEKLREELAKAEGRHRKEQEKLLGQIAQLRKQLNQM